MLREALGACRKGVYVDMFGCRETLGGGGVGLKLLGWYKKAVAEHSKLLEMSFTGVAFEDRESEQNLMKVLKMSVDVGFYNPLLSKSRRDKSIDLRLLKKDSSVTSRLGVPEIYTLFGAASNTR